MWSVIIVAIIALIAIVSYSIWEGDFVKGDHTNNFFISVCCLLLTGAVALGMFCIVLLGSAVMGAKEDISHKLVETENYYLAEIVDNKYVSISSNAYNFATKEDGVVHFQHITATESNTVKVCEDTYKEDEYPMVFIDRYVVGGTFFLDNFTFCNWLNVSSETTFYIPEGSVGTFIVEVK